VCLEAHGGMAICVEKSSNADAYPGNECNTETKQLLGPLLIPVWASLDIAVCSCGVGTL